MRSFSGSMLGLFRDSAIFWFLSVWFAFVVWSRPDFATDFEPESRSSYQPRGVQSSAEKRLALCLWFLRLLWAFCTAPLSYPRGTSVSCCSAYWWLWLYPELFVKMPLPLFGFPLSVPWSGLALFLFKDDSSSELFWLALLASRSWKGSCPLSWSQISSSSILVWNCPLQAAPVKDYLCNRLSMWLVQLWGLSDLAERLSPSQRSLEMSSDQIHLGVFLLPCSASPPIFLVFNCKHFGCDCEAFSALTSPVRRQIFATGQELFGLSDTLDFQPKSVLLPLFARYCSCPDSCQSQIHWTISLSEG